MVSFLALACFALAARGEGALLPTVPQGWRREHLEFPLAFAPELDFEGIEELAFAPGMFEPASDSYFSYAFALRLAGDIEVDEALLTHFLETYYRGLCRAVAAERGLDRDTDAIAALVDREGARFRARIDLFDPFTTGESLALELELAVHCAPGATEICALASPVQDDAPIWSELREVGRAWRAARPAPVFLNHVFAVVDGETYAALAGSTFLRETFAVSEERTTVRADISYTGLYFYGRRTYFEFLSAQAAAGLVEGATGLALGLETQGALDELASRLGEREVGTQRGPITRQLGETQVPWFQILGVEMPPSALQVFAMEYDPRFLAGWHPELAPAGGGLARADVLARYAAALGKVEAHANAPFTDVISVELALSDAERERLLSVCAAAGWEVEQSAGVWTCSAPQFRLVLRPSDAPGGISAFELALRAPIERKPLELGRAVLSFRGETARFELRR